MDEGFRVDVARDGVEALANIDATQPTLILLDMHLPGLDGWHVADEIQARGVQSPIVVMTGASDARKTAQEIGAAGYIPKPVNLAGLLKKIDDLCA